MIEHSKKGGCPTGGLPFSFVGTRGSGFEPESQDTVNRLSMLE
jgi:hypothetical protein